MFSHNLVIQHTTSYVAISDDKNLQRRKSVLIKDSSIHSIIIGNLVPFSTLNGISCRTYLPA